MSSSTPSVSTPSVSTLSVSTRPEATPSFAELGVPAALVAALARHGIQAPFAIQTAAIPDALAGRDVLGKARTGSGKTLAFGIPMIARLAGTSAAPKRPRGLVLVPTRELAQQVHDGLEPLGHALGLRSRPVVGGTSFPKQAEALRRGVDLLVATPGRLIDLIEQGACSLADVEIVVLDEADHMADMGFLPAVRKLLDQVAPGGQRLLFSATLDGDVSTLVRRYLADPMTHSVEPDHAPGAGMDHHLFLVSNDDKAQVTAEIAGREGRTLLFVRTKHGADRLTKQLRRQGVAAAALHGGKAQNARTRTLAEFREGNTPVLVATDVAARGIHVDDISLVVHVDPPADPKDYLHRAGRTARAGESGVVVTLVLPHQEKDVSKLAAQAGVQAERSRVRPGDADLARVTGARQPTGVALAERPVESRSQSSRPARTGRSDRSARGEQPKRGPRRPARAAGGSSAGRDGSRGQRRSPAAR